ncbi:MAG: gamma carbonic anhydrase family protein [Deltaproteobacteria bacterium]|nr:gamma carbonic anhydrase family protein [Deltaproteobacteria bacterium]
MIRSVQNRTPRVDPKSFVAPSAEVIGDVVIGAESSVWFQTVIRGDVHSIKIGSRTNIQDHCVVHVTRSIPEQKQTGQGTLVGDEVTVGHRVVLHGCKIGNRCLIGIGAILMDGVEIGDECIIAAGSLLTPGTKIPSGKLVLGSPAKIKRDITADEKTWIQNSAANYAEYARWYR